MATRKTSWLRLPSAFTILFIVLILAVIGTWPVRRKASAP